MVRVCPPRYSLLELHRENVAYAISEDGHVLQVPFHCIACDWSLTNHTMRLAYIHNHTMQLIHRKYSFVFKAAGFTRPTDL